MGGVEEWRIKPSQLSTKLKLKLSLAIWNSWAQIYIESHTKFQTATFSRSGALIFHNLTYHIVLN